MDNDTWDEKGRRQGGRDNSGARPRVPSWWRHVVTVLRWNAIVKTQSAIIESDVG